METLVHFILFLVAQLKKNPQNVWAKMKIFCSFSKSSADFAETVKNLHFSFNLI